MDTSLAFIGAQWSTMQLWSGCIWQADSVRIQAVCVTMARIISCVAIWHVASSGGGPSAAAEIIPCCNVRTAERAPLQSLLRKRHCHTQLANCARPYLNLSTHAVSFTKQTITFDDPRAPVTRLLHNGRKCSECVRKKYPKYHRSPS